eukprot:1156662-Pelagomonas_calceolata.AAC.20
MARIYDMLLTLNRGWVGNARHQKPGPWHYKSTLMHHIATPASMHHNAIPDTRKWPQHCATDAVDMAQA